MTETVGIAVGGVSNNYPQQNHIPINKEQIKVKDFHTLTLVGWLMASSDPI